MILKWNRLLMLNNIHIVYYYTSEQRHYTVQKGCLEWKRLSTGQLGRNVFISTSNITNTGEGSNHIFAQVGKARIRNAQTTNAQMWCLWLEYKDMKQRTSSWCMRHNENKMLIWIFHGENLCDNCLRVHFPTAIHYSTSTCDLRRGVYSYISLEKKQNLMKSMNKMMI